MLFYVILLLSILTRIILLLFFYLINFFFMKIVFVFSCSGMFRDVPECSVFRVLSTPSLQCRRILGGRNLVRVRVRDNVVAAMYPNNFFLKYPLSQ